MLSFFVCDETDHALITNSNWDGGNLGFIYEEVQELDSAVALCRCIWEQAEWPVLLINNVLLLHERCSPVTLQTHYPNRNITFVVAYILFLISRRQHGDVFPELGFSHDFNNEIGEFYRPLKDRDIRDALDEYIDRQEHQEYIEAYLGTLKNIVRGEAGNQGAVAAPPAALNFIDLVHQEAQRIDGLPNINVLDWERGEVHDEGEYDKHYNRTYVKTNSGWVVYDKKLAKEVVSVYAALTHSYTAEVKIKNILFKDIDFTPLKNGVYNTQLSVVQICKSPNRQWKRGICRETYEIKSLPNAIANLVYENSFNVEQADFKIWGALNQYDWGSYSSVLYLLNSITPNYYPIDTAIRSIYEGKTISRAVSDKIWVMASPVGGSIKLFYKEILIGDIVKEKVVKINTLFRQEIIDLLYRSNSTLRIE